MIKLHKYLVEQKVGSQKYCETLIKEGKVEVDGVTNYSPVQLVDPHHQTITVCGENIKSKPAKYLILNKPKNYLSHFSKWHKNIYNLLPPKYHNLYPIGRLDKESEGLLILTNDGKLNHFITHPANNISKTYLVHIDSYLQSQHTQKLMKGIFFEGGKTKPLKIKIIKKSRNLTVCLVTIFEGKKRELRRVFARFGYKVRKLKRIAIGNIKIGDTPPGFFREVSSNYIINNLYEKTSKPF